MNIISPTGMEPRGVDDFGSGAFHAGRGGRLHAGVDYECIPNQNIVMPIEGKITRYSSPYVSDLRWKGIAFENRYMGLKMFYLLVEPQLIGQFFEQGTIIGKAQNIAERYNTETKRMIPHVHLQIDWINPEGLRV